ncbi:MAG: hypothetical protein HC789_14060 [Microcoleus sp. CSU_2_2]|nr:hypothetical protein [Microcoleus sp. SU_5_3]NJS11410.1 hypothetical protein [Microcoleus sp. CSU_2_2]
MTRRLKPRLDRPNPPTRVEFPDLSVRLRGLCLFSSGFNRRNLSDRPRFPSFNPKSLPPFDIWPNLVYT